MKSLLCAVLICVGSIAAADWKPPAKPDPDKILSDAARDTRAGRYADALAKHLWYHENALRYNPSASGVRLSFALAYWVELGKKYPPAIEKLKSIRDKAGSYCRERHFDHDLWNSCVDFAAINHFLCEDAKTSELFVWLDRELPNNARPIYTAAESALIKAKEYRLCGKYIDPESYEITVLGYRDDKVLSKDPTLGGAEFLDFSEKRFSNETATLVALLVRNNRQAEADKIIQRALKERNDSAFRKELEKAKKGDVPPPYP